MSNSDFPKWFKLYRNKLKDLTTKYDVSWQHEDNNITVIGRKAIEGGVNDAPNTGQISSISQPQQSGKAEQIWN